MTTDVETWRRRLMPGPGKGEFEPGQDDPFDPDSYYLESDDDGEIHQVVGEGYQQ